MALFHLSVKTISRSGGRSATGAAAYRAACEITDERTGMQHDYSRKGGVMSADLLLPEGAPAWARERGVLWNAAELAETRVNSTVAREFEIALPGELTPSQRRDLAVDFARELVNRHGLVADVAIHAPGREGDTRNHHAHILCTTRKLEQDGFTRKTRELDVRGSGEVTRWRARFAEMQNERLRDYGHAVRVDHRTLRDQGIDRPPTRHLGVAASAMERRGLRTEIGDLNRAIAAAYEKGRAEREIAHSHHEKKIDVDTSLRQALAERSEQPPNPVVKTDWRQYQQLQRQLALQGKASLRAQVPVAGHQEQMKGRDQALDQRQERDLSREQTRQREREKQRGIER